ncbi:MAG: DUF2484 family protein [Pseudomonadota bacterium]
MTSLALVCGWLILANVIAMFPSKRSHWPQAYFLMAVGAPLLAFVAHQHGVFVALVVLLGMASILRWPVRYLVRWVRRKLGNKEAGL